MKRIIASASLVLLTIAVSGCGSPASVNKSEAKIETKNSTSVTPDAEKETSSRSGEISEKITEKKIVEDKMLEEMQKENEKISGDIEVYDEGLYISSADTVLKLLSESPRGDSYNVYLSNASEVFEQYRVIYESSGKVTGITDIFCFFKDFYTREDVDSMDMEIYYPGITGLSFVDILRSEADDYCIVSIKWSNLNNMVNINEMISCGHIITAAQPDENGLDSAVYNKELQEQGAIHVSYVQGKS